MSGADPLLAIGQKLTAVLASTYATSDPNAALVFLTGGANVPADLVQSGMINPVQMQAFLTINFDAPFVISMAESAVHGKDDFYGTASQIYTLAATTAEPLGNPGDDGFKRVSAEIVAAQTGLQAAGMHGSLTCEPDDWALPANTGYWTVFDSTQSQPAPPAATAPVASPGPVRVFNPQLWHLRPPIMPVAAPVTIQNRAEIPVRRMPMQAGLGASPAMLETMRPALQAYPPPAVAAQSMLIMRPIAVGPATPPPASPPPAPIPATTITVQLQYQCVSLAFASGGVTWWDGSFLSDTGWYVPGMQKGGLLPLPQSTAAESDLAYGVPVALIVIQGLTVSGNWTGDAAAALTAPGAALGPFSLNGAVSSPAKNGLTSYTCPGMQVVALICSRLPVLPPADSPTAAATTSAAPSPVPAPAPTPAQSTTTSVPAPATSPDGASPTPTPGSDGTLAASATT